MTTTKIWKVVFKENMDRFDVVAKDAGQAQREAVRLFKANIEQNIQDYNKTPKAEREEDNKPTKWSWYVRNGFTSPETIELIAESDN